MTYSDAITKKIIGLCQERRITFNRFADLYGVSQSIVENIVKGISKNSRLKTLNQLANDIRAKLPKRGIYGCAIKAGVSKWLIL